MGRVFQAALFDDLSRMHETMVEEFRGETCKKVVRERLCRFPRPHDIPRLKWVGIRKVF